jgi:hypothetical protein
LITRGELVDILLENQSDFEVNFGDFSFMLESIVLAEPETTTEMLAETPENSSKKSNKSTKSSKTPKSPKTIKQKFNIPQDTIIDSNSNIKIASEISRFTLTESITEYVLNLYYPNGKNADSHAIQIVDMALQL